MKRPHGQKLHVEADLQFHKDVPSLSLSESLILYRRVRIEMVRPVNETVSASKMKLMFHFVSSRQGSYVPDFRSGDPCHNSLISETCFILIMRVKRTQT